jgi:hypothetical protein
MTDQRRAGGVRLAYVELGSCVDAVSDTSQYSPGSECVCPATITLDRQLYSADRAISSRDELAAVVRTLADLR